MRSEVLRGDLLNPRLVLDSKDLLRARTIFKPRLFNVSLALCASKSVRIPLHSHGGIRITLLEVVFHKMRDKEAPTAEEFGSD